MAAAYRANVASQCLGLANNVPQRHQEVAAKIFREVALIDQNAYRNLTLHYVYTGNHKVRAHAPARPQTITRTRRNAIQRNAAHLLMLLWRTN